MPRRVTLPGADELFRSTGGSTRSGAELAPVRDRAQDVESHTAPASGFAPTAIGRSAAARPTGPRYPSGRQRHDEKITVYVSPEELVDLEHARLILRSEHGLAVDRGRIVREALAVILADLESKGGDSIVVRRLRAS